MFSKDVVDKLQLPDIYKVFITYVLDKIHETPILDPDEIWLFGSCARGTIKSGSDVDILLFYNEHQDAVIARSRRIERSMIEESTWDLSENGFIELDMVVRSKEELDSSDFVFNTYVKEDKVVLYQK